LFSDPLKWHLVLKRRKTMESVTRRLANFASAHSYDDLDTRIIQNFKKYLLDGIGCGIHGNSFTWCQIVNEFIKEQEGPKESTLWLQGFRGPCANVALGLGVMIHSFDFDDYHNAKVHPGAVVIPAAVVDGARSVRFLVGPSGGMGKADGSAGRTDVTYGEALDMDGLSLDVFVFERNHPPPQVVKMDIEGGEVLALPGMRRRLDEAQPILMLELHGPEAARCAWETLSSRGYRLCRMAPGYPQVPKREALDWKAYLLAFPS
jgi:FkbM family methyltransferase